MTMLPSDAELGVTGPPARQAPRRRFGRASRPRRAARW
ncbi:hypothetical protein KCH_33710 [Kitasatospora cheerisanensis KCTC 2395]|uniref:Uncharacterized protein n=1 Tax=Kitasatospora cheerisanensis KCTC 2395 TaxID=1348663 RepID=A0A066YXY6_9ACTN|nr:hypothetical protein KCH_33710 [Kitasatospora cheerisanensis KCTC 2395]